MPPAPRSQADAESERRLQRAARPLVGPGGHGDPHRREGKRGCKGDEHLTRCEMAQSQSEAAAYGAAPSLRARGPPLGRCRAVPVGLS